MNSRAWRVTAALALIGVSNYACGSDERGDPSGSENGTPTASSSGKGTSSGDGGGAGSAGGGGAAGAGGVGGVGSCDGSVDCELCIQCAVNAPCQAAYIGCVNDLACDQALFCLTACGDNCLGDTGCYAVCAGSCSSTQVAHKDAVALLNCLCVTECPQDCAAHTGTDCTNFL